MDGRRFAVGAGEALFIPANKPHAYGADDHDPWSIHWAHFAGTAAASYASLLPAHQYLLSIPSTDAQKIPRMFRESYRLASTGLNERTLLLASHILRYVLGILFFKTGRSLGGRSHAMAHDLGKSIEFMRANLSRSLTLQELSWQAGLSPTRYSLVFREQAGSPPVDHHIHLRMQATCHYLDSTALSIKEVAAKLGYDDPYYFSRMFQKILGCPPLAYRRSVKGDDARRLRFIDRSGATQPTAPRRAGALPETKVLRGMVEEFKNGVIETRSVFRYWFAFLNQGSRCGIAEMHALQAPTARFPCLRCFQSQRPPPSRSRTAVAQVSGSGTGAISPVNPISNAVPAKPCSKSPL